MTQYVGARLGEERMPIFEFICDCGSDFVVKLVDAECFTGSAEFAVTCGQCLEPQWMTIRKLS